jgi:thiol-disulfide isomerase/thioredoxin
MGVATATANETAVYEIESVTKRGENKAPDFTWRENGVLKTFSQVSRGKIVLINLWATWCGPCRKEIPDLIELSRELGSEVLVIGVSEDESSKLTAVVNYVEKNHITYLNLFDNNKQLAKAFGGIAAIPTTFVINKAGIIVQKIVGARSKLQFLDAVQKAQ